MVRRPWDSFLMGARLAVRHVLQYTVFVDVYGHVQEHLIVWGRAPFNRAAIELDLACNAYSFIFGVSVYECEAVVDVPPVEWYLGMVENITFLLEVPTIEVSKIGGISNAHGEALQLLVIFFLVLHDE